MIMMVPDLNIWSSTIIVVVFSVVLILADEYVAKPWRQRKWERQAASGDKEKQELLRLARSAHVVEE
jgi:hypothetical protein